MNTNKTHDTCKNAQLRAKQKNIALKETPLKPNGDSLKQNTFVVPTRMPNITYSIEFDILKWKCHKVSSLLSKHAKGIKFNFMQWFDKTQT